MASTAAGTNVDWRNVNDWHWTERDCRAWARDYLKQHLIGINVNSGPISISTVTFIDSDGDVNVNTRKGKTITLFDLNISFRWRGKNETNNVEANGKIIVPEFMHDTEMDEIVFEYELDAPNDDRREIEKVVRRLMPDEIRKVLGRFGSDLFKAHVGTDAPIATVTKSSKGAPKQSADSTSSDPVVKPHQLGPNSMSTIRSRITFNCPPEAIFKALLDPDMVKVWSRYPAVISSQPGPFNLFNGNVTGEIKEVVPGKSISMLWRLKSWADGHSSSVVLNFDDLGGMTSMGLVQVGVPNAEKEATETNWERYYWRAIKDVLGY